MTVQLVEIAHQFAAARHIPMTNTGRHPSGRAFFCGEQEGLGTMYGTHDRDQAAFYEEPERDDLKSCVVALRRDDGTTVDLIVSPDTLPTVRERLSASPNALARRLVKGLEKAVEEKGMFTVRAEKTNLNYLPAVLNALYPA